MPPFIRTLLQAVVGLVVIAVIWFAAAIVVDNPLWLPAPPIVFAKILDLATSDDYLKHARESLTALLFGLVPALVVGVLVGLLARAQPMRWILKPIVMVIAGAPVLALYPLFVTWGGLTFVPRATLIFVAAAFPIMNAIMMHSSSGPTRAATSSGNEIAAAPSPPHGTAISILSGLRLGVILGMAALVLSEFTAASRGAAYLIMSSSAMLDTSMMLATFLLISIPTVLIVAILQGIEEQIAD